MNDGHDGGTRLAQRATMRARAPLGFLALSTLILAACSSGPSDSDHQADGEPTAQQSDDSDEADDDTAQEADDDAASSDLNATDEGVGDGTSTGSGMESSSDATADASSESVELTDDDSAAEEGSGATSTPEATPSADTSDTTETDTTETDTTDAASGHVAMPPDPDFDPCEELELYDHVHRDWDLETETEVNASSILASVWDDNLNFDWYSSYREDFLDAQLAGAPDYGIEKHEAAQERWASEASAKDVLDIALVLETTKRMGNELSYLQTEFLALASTIDATYANSEQRWSLVVYRDEGAEYVVRHYDFRSDLDEFQKLLAEQSNQGSRSETLAAPERALATTGQLSWRSGTGVARLAFWVAGAPHHEQNVDALEKAVLGLQELDVHLYPVAVPEAEYAVFDAMAEYSMRSAAQLTLGRYLFRNNGPVCGSMHRELIAPCCYVTTLEDVMLHMVALEMTGKVVLPGTNPVSYSVGKPDIEGVCTFESGNTAQALF